MSKRDFDCCEGTNNSEFTVEQEAYKKGYLDGTLSQLEVVADAYGAGRRDAEDRMVDLLEDDAFLVVMSQVIVWAPLTTDEVRESVANWILRGHNQDELVTNRQFDMWLESVKLEEFRAGQASMTEIP